jgi:hypothetical protein
MLCIAIIFLPEKKRIYQEYHILKDYTSIGYLRQK